MKEVSKRFLFTQVEFRPLRSDSDETSRVGSLTQGVSVIELSAFKSIPNPPKIAMQKSYRIFFDVLIENRISPGHFQREQPFRFHRVAILSETYQTFVPRMNTNQNIALFRSRKRSPDSVQPSCRLDGIQELYWLGS